MYNVTEQLKVRNNFIVSSFLRCIFLLFFCYICYTIYKNFKLFILSYLIKFIWFLDNYVLKLNLYKM